jgi:hypothetical protein
MTKLRSDATPLDRLKDELDMALFVEHQSYEQVVALLAEKHGVKTSKTSVFRWYQRRAKERVLEKITENARTARDISDRVKGDDAHLDPAIRGLIRNAALGLLQSEQADHQTLSVVVGALLKWNEQDIKSADLSLKRDKFARETCSLFLKWQADEKARAIASGEGNNEEKINALQRLMFPELFMEGHE